VNAMRVYLAGRRSRRLELCGYREQLRVLKIDVTSRWLNGEHQVGRVGAIGEESGSDDEAARLRARLAAEDMADVRFCDMVIAFTEAPRAEASHGGRHVELGMALAWGKRIIICGPRENVFCWLPNIEAYVDFSLLVDSTDWRGGECAIDAVDA
jgi:nucleoside 2-deoxyribosyltransferase